MENYLKEYYGITLHLVSQEEADFVWRLLFDASAKGLELDYNKETLIINEIKKCENRKCIKITLQKIDKENTNEETL